MPTRPIPGRAIGLSTDNSIHDEFVQAAIDDDPTMAQHKMRLKPRFATLASHDDDDIMDWGQRNLVALSDVTSKKNKLAARLSQIDTLTWINKAMEASSKPPGLMNRLFGGAENPQFFKTKLGHIRTELLTMRRDLKTLYDEVFPDAEDLRMDIVALTVYHRGSTGKFDDVIVQGRLRTLTSAQQTVMITIMAIEDFRATVASHITTIDNLLQVTIPNWELAESQK